MRSCGHTCGDKVDMTQLWLLIWFAANLCVSCLHTLPAMRLSLKNCPAITLGHGASFFTEILRSLIMLTYLGCRWTPGAGGGRRGGCWFKVRQASQDLLFILIFAIILTGASSHVWGMCVAQALLLYICTIYAGPANAHTLGMQHFCILSWCIMQHLHILLFATCTNSLLQHACSVNIKRTQYACVHCIVVSMPTCCKATDFQ